MVNIYGIELRNVNRFSGMEDDEGFNADIYIDGKKAGTARYMADGGPVDIDFVSDELAIEFAKRRHTYYMAIKPVGYDGNLVKSICPVERTHGEFNADYFSTDDESFVYRLLELTDLQKDWNKFKKKYGTTAFARYGARITYPGGTAHACGSVWNLPLQDTKAAVSKLPSIQKEAEKLFKESKTKGVVVEAFLMEVIDEKDFMVGS